MNSSKKLKTIGAVSYLMQRKGWSEDEAIRRFMTSEVYNVLQNEETKAWYYSDYQLSLLFEDEMEGHLIWP